MWLRLGPELLISVDAYKKLTLGLHLAPWAFLYGVRWNWAQNLPWKMFLSPNCHSEADRAKERRRKGRIHMRQVASQHTCWKFYFTTIFIKIVHFHLWGWGGHGLLWFVYSCDKHLVNTFLTFVGLFGIRAENL